MFLLGLAVTVAYIPGWTGWLMPTGWALLSCLLLLALWDKGEIGPLHWLGLFFLVFAFASAFWAVDGYVAVWRLWQLAILALAFWRGSTATSLVPLWRGLALGLAISGVVAIAQWYGFRPVLQGTGSPGLFFNPMIFGEACALAALGLLCTRQYAWLPCIVSGLILCDYRGAIAGLVLGLVAMFRRPVLVGAVGVFGLLMVAASFHPTDVARYQAWQAAWSNLTPFGWGAGSFETAFYLIGNQIIHPGYVHNDFLQLGFEYGVGAIAIYLVIGAAAMQVRSKEWPVLVAWLAMACFSFPMESPVLALVGAMVTGRLAADWNRLRGLSLHRRSSRVPVVVPIQLRA